MDHPFPHPKPFVLPLLGVIKYRLRLGKLKNKKPSRIAERLVLQRGRDCSYAHPCRTAPRESPFGRFQTRGFSSLSFNCNDGQKKD